MLEGYAHLPEDDCAPRKDAIFIPALAHISPILGMMMLLPVIISELFETDPKIRRHCAEAFDFQMTVLLAILGTQGLSIVTSDMVYLAAGLSTLIGSLAVVMVLYGVIKAVCTILQVPFDYPPSIRLLRPLEDMLMKQEVV